MKRAMTLATGLAVGYVAGAHAGRERYDQIKQKAHELSQQPAVASAGESLREHAGTATKTVTDAVTDLASGLAHKLHSGTGDDENRPFPADPATYAPPPGGAAPGDGHAV